ncbi:MAG: STAS domain-containing protein [Actinobacteria bacterium]|nr:MAG: STAS domain-containing protein [Actinomycetota bacterium]
MAARWGSNPRPARAAGSGSRFPPPDRPTLRVLVRLGSQGVMSRPFQLCVERLQDGVSILAVVGELDLATAPHFRRGVGGLLGSGGRRLVVDLSDADFLDSTGLGALVWAQFRAGAAGGELVVAGAEDAVAKTIATSGLDDLIALAASRADALARFGVGRSPEVRPAPSARAG